METKWKVLFTLGRQRVFGHFVYQNLSISIVFLKIAPAEKNQFVMNNFCDFDSACALKLPVRNQFSSILRKML